ncbi:MAG: family 1 glycosylhydrolase [Cellulomonas sp.]
MTTVGAPTDQVTPSGTALDISRFPQGSCWGAATAAYQIEGGVAEGGRGPSTWGTFAHTAGRTVHGDTGDIDGDGYWRWPNNNRFFPDPLFPGAHLQDVHDLYADAALSGVIRDGDLEVISTPIDFLGVNHYHQVIASHDADDLHLGAAQHAAAPASTSSGWSVRPELIQNFLVRASGYTDVPLYVTECGACFDDYVDPTGQVRDTERIDHLHGYPGAVADAIADGAYVRGYYAWSLLDDLEWSEGYSKRFGLVFVDYATQTRIPKGSAVWYREQIAAHTRAVGQDHPGLGTAGNTHHHKEMAR